MKALPDDLHDATLLRGLAAYGITPTDVTYAPVGFGDYHWKVTGDDDRHWFVTVSDLEHKEHCGAGAEAALKGLRQAMDTAVALRERDGLRFVVAPIAPTALITPVTPIATADVADVIDVTHDSPVVPLGARYALTVFPHIDGHTGEFGQKLDDADRDRVLALLAQLHSRTPPDSTPTTPLEPAGLTAVHTALRDLATPWSGGPFAEPARHLLADHATALRTRLADFDALAAHVRRRAAPLVVTHGEPHPGNLVQADDGYLLVDWDTVGLAVPERDLSLLADDPAALTHYTELTGRALDAEALELYRLRWSLLDVAEFVRWFRGPHGRTSDTQSAWDGFTGALTQLAG
ncbi:phosphotransferase family protein [Streptomyces lasiicapitis]|uniref:Aminoglycoside phosphotransferase domain-containing protein n=1 Tax=Streptomyces lasiicapitis TaxID=1923961 RepID=A0ABQ2MA23_9ACTN|nr:phosphotransferase [Streptomyces lasiicapitis]GGO48838.1 hypothetical protein GCM10012286_45380 [Streptomyces lasiicapitis]